MPTYKFKGGLYKNVNEVGLGLLSPEFINGYFDEFDNINKRPGKVVWTNVSGSGKIQGLFFFRQKGCLIAVKDGKTYKISFNKTVTNKFTDILTNTTNPVSFASDGGSVLMASGGRMLLLDWNTGEPNAVFVSHASAPTSVSHVAYLDGCYIANKVGTHQFYYTSPVDRGLWSGLQMASAEANPDTIIAIHVYNRELYLFGQKTTELWYNSGNPQFSRMGHGVLEVGCSAPYSIVQCNNTFYWLDDNKRFVKLVGRGVQPISIPIQTELHKIGDMNAVVALPLSIKGKNWILLNIPDLNVTYCYDVDLNYWYQWGLGASFTAIPYTCYTIVDSGLTTTFLSEEQKCNRGFNYWYDENFPLEWNNPNAISEHVSGYAYCSRPHEESQFVYPSIAEQDDLPYNKCWRDIYKGRYPDYDFTYFVFTATTGNIPNIYYKQFPFTLSSNTVLTGISYIVDAYTTGTGDCSLWGLDIKSNINGVPYQWSFYTTSIQINKNNVTSHHGFISIKPNSTLTIEILKHPNTSITPRFVPILKGGYGDPIDEFIICVDSMAVKLWSYNIPTNFKATQFLAAQDFGFNIPSNATITGMKVKYDIVKVIGNPKDYHIGLMLNGVPTGTTVAKNETISTPSLIRGSISDLWGVSLTPSAINNPTFGVGLSVGTYEGDEIQIGDVSLTVYYKTSIQGFDSSVGYLYGHTSNGNILEMKSNEYTDSGHPITFKWRTGNIHYDTLHYKRSNKVTFRLKRGSIELLNTNFSFRWKDENATWSSSRTISLGAVNDVKNTIDIHRLGIYQTRQYEITHSAPTNFILVDVEENVEVLTR